VSEQSYTTYRVARRPKRRSWRVVVLASVLVLAGLAGTGAFLARAESGALPPGIEIDGVDVGGLSVAEARAVLDEHETKVAAEPIVLAFEGGTLETSGAELGATSDADAVIQRALDSRSAFSRLRTRLGLADALEYPLTFTVDVERLDQVLDRVAAQVERKPRRARVVVDGDAVVVKQAQTGLELDLDAAADTLSTLPDRADLTLVEVEPRVTDEDATAAKATADSLLASAPVVVHRERRLELDPDVLRDSLRFKARQGEIEVSLDPALLERPLNRAFKRFERAPKDATFKIVGKRVRVVPSRRGSAVSVGRTASALIAGVGTPEVQALFEPTVPDLTTEEAKAMRIRELVSEFTTPYACCQNRVLNIQRAAEILDGQIIRAGARFSLNKALGERTSERGFVLAPMISAGRLEDAVGGGVSQVATTMYNAAFFAGLDLIDATPHEFYISRYPMGREATVSWGGPELIFKNDWPAAILIDVVAADTSITVRLFSTKLGRKVETETGDPYAYTSATTVRVFNPDLPPGTETTVQSGGISGFTVTYTRKVYRFKKLIRDEEFTVRYRPENTIVEYGPKPRGNGGGGGSAGGSGAGAGAGGGGSGGGGSTPTEEPPTDGGTEPPPPPT
jgi:vancomycin resistance protein YoaR